MAQRNAQIETMQKELQRRETHKKEQKTALLMAVREVVERIPTELAFKFDQPLKTVLEMFYSQFYNIVEAPRHSVSDAW